MTQVDLVVVPVNDQAAGEPLSKMDYCIVVVQDNVLVLLALAPCLCLLLWLPLLPLLVELALHVLEHLLHVFNAVHCVHAHHVEGDIKKVSLHF